MKNLLVVAHGRPSFALSTIDSDQFLVSECEGVLHLRALSNHEGSSFLRIAHDCGSSPSCLCVTLEEGSKVHLVEVGAFSSAFFVIKKNATLHHFLTGSSSSSCQVSVEESGAYHAVSVEDKHASSRNLQVLLEGSRAAMTLSHLSCGFDHEIKMNIDHQMPFTSSSILVKGVVDDGRRSYCESIVEMQKQAAHSESQQHFKYVTLGESAQARCSPKFAFHTDDIHASHGVTIQQFDQEMLFYLQARGLEKNEAKKQYLDGFCDEVLKNVCPFGIV